MLVHDLYVSPALVSCFDDEGAAGGSVGGVSDGAGTGDGAGAGASAGGSGVVDKTFTQDQVNKMLAEDRRKHQAALLKSEQTYKDLLANNQNLSAKERQTLEDSLATVQGQLRTKEQQAALEKRQLEETYSAKLTEGEKRYQELEQRWREENINRSLLDAAVSGDAFNPNLMVVQLRQMAKLVEVMDKNTGKPTGRYTTVIEFPDVDATTGEAIMTSRTPEEAVKRMKELPELYGGLFKSNVVSGVGLNSSTGFSPGTGGKVDLKNLTTDQYREIRAKNPELLGLRSQRLASRR